MPKIEEPIIKVVRIILEILGPALIVPEAREPPTVNKAPIPVHLNKALNIPPIISPSKTQTVLMVAVINEILPFSNFVSSFFCCMHRR